MRCEFADDEVALALALSRVAAGARLDTAIALESLLPQSLTAWEHGQIDAAKVRAIVDACRYVSPEQANTVERRVLARAPGQIVG